MMACVSSTLRSALGQLSPRGRRWRRFLKSLPLDPEALSAPLDEPGGRDFIICGASRTGTSLLAGALFQPPHVVSVMEPWAGMCLPPADLYRSIRREIRETGQLRQGRLDVSILADEHRVAWCRDGANPIDIDVDEPFALGIKWPIYWRFLDYLPTTKFLICVRDPVEVVASFKRVGGRLAMGLDYDTAFNRDMNNHLLAATSDHSTRRILLYEYVNRRVIPHIDRDNVMLVGYERWFGEPDQLMSDIGDFLDVELGKLPVDIRRPQEEASTRSLVDTIRELAPSARELGYMV